MDFDICIQEIIIGEGRNARDWWCCPHCLLHVDVCEICIWAENEFGEDGGDETLVCEVNCDLEVGEWDDGVKNLICDVVHEYEQVQVETAEGEVNDGKLGGSGWTLVSRRVCLDARV